MKSRHTAREGTQGPIGQDISKCATSDHYGLLLIRVSGIALQLGGIEAHESFSHPPIRSLFQSLGQF